MKAEHLPRLAWPLVIGAVAVLIFLIRLNGGTDLESYGQPVHIGYLLDLLTQGHLFVQRDLDNAMMATPPLHTWLIAPFAAMFGFNRLALTLPAFLSVLAICFLLFSAGHRHFGKPAGGLATIAFVLSPATAKQIALVGTGPVFSLAVTAAALAAYAAGGARPGRQNSKLCWLLFWLASALATLTMGILGLVFAAGGLLSLFWHGTSDQQHGKELVVQIAGIALFVGIILAWLIPAGLQAGFGPIAQTMLPEATRWKAVELLNPIVALFSRYLPFSLFTLFALWQVIRHPAKENGARRFERFLAGWLIVGLIAASSSAQNGGDLVFALWPAGALLAGREMARLAERMGNTKFTGVAVVIGCILVGATYNAVHSIGHAKLATSPLGRELRLAANAEDAAKALKARGIDIASLYHLDTPNTLQLYLGTFRPLIDRPTLSRMLDSTNQPLDLATGETGIESIGGMERFPNTLRIFRWPAEDSLAPVVQVYRIAR